jgi:hypothetical protein
VAAAATDTAGESGSRQVHDPLYDSQVIPLTLNKVRRWDNLWLPRCIGTDDTWRMIVELRSVPGCPNLAVTREVLTACLAELSDEVGQSVSVVERVGEYPSPSVLVDGRDVTGADTRAPAACVLRPPTAEQIRAALREAATAG